ncbi:hypothetical protein EGC82_20160 [Shewanella livingstonensis]|uniref:Uncharacterized protein n=1 Tax=Shewanella livingstonensis TaxID=150120 RepID=A0A3G8M1R8_9GAMM|nr:hypothetical protein EGC82_20160 [Shewanella livingstonensis]
MATPTSALPSLLATVNDSAPVIASNVSSLTITLLASSILTPSVTGGITTTGGTTTGGTTTGGTTTTGGSITTTSSSLSLLQPNISNELANMALRYVTFIVRSLIVMSGMTGGAFHITFNTGSRAHSLSNTMA